jgi:hypothetical protein
LDRRFTRSLGFAATIVAGLTIGSAAVSEREPPAPDAPAALLTLRGDLRAGTADIVERAFEVPFGTTQIDLDVTVRNGDSADPVDFGLRGPAGIRGWSTARHDHIHIDALSADYGYLPGPIEPGEWYVLLGAPPGGAPDAQPYAVTVRLSDRPEVTHRSLNEVAGWYAGDLHVHSGHSDGYRDAGRRPRTPVSVEELAHHAIDQGLDFLAITDHNTASHWIDVNRVQDAMSGLLMMHGREITTARGHFNAVGERRFTDFRLGPERPMSRLLADVARDGAFVSVNHAWLTSDEWCGGCGWQDRDADTLDRISGIEVMNGGTPDPEAEMPGWRWWADLLNGGRRLTAVGGSDAHDPAAAAAAIGAPSTVVWAAALSEDAMIEGLKTGRAFIRAVPDTRLFVDLQATGRQGTALMGQTIRPGRLTLNALIQAAPGDQCVWIRRGLPARVTDIPANVRIETLNVDAAAGDWFSVIVRRNRRPVLISNAVYVRD